MYGFTPRSANQPASDKQLCYAYDLAERQGLDAEALCSIHFSKEFAEMTANEASQLTLPPKSMPLKNLVWHRSIRMEYGTMLFVKS